MARQAAERHAVSGVVPAVERAIALLHHLQDNMAPSACTVTRIAEALDLNKSTCSNILRTLQAGGLVAYDPDARCYGLGPELIGLGASAGRRDARQIELRHLEAVVRQTGFSCVLFEQLPNEQFLIVAKVDSFREIKVTIDIGQHFPPWAPALARLATAWRSRDEAAAYFRRWARPASTPTAVTGLKANLAKLEPVRAQGYAVSIGEYYPANTAISAPIFTARGGPCRGFCLVAFSAELPEARIPKTAALVRDAARAVTRDLGGAWPA